MKLIKIVLLLVSLNFSCVSVKIDIEDSSDKPKETIIDTALDLSKKKNQPVKVDSLFYR